MKLKGNSSVEEAATAGDYRLKSLGCSLAFGEDEALGVFRWLEMMTAVFCVVKVYDLFHFRSYVLFYRG